MKSNPKAKKNCQDLISKFNKSKSDIPTIIKELDEYIPDFTKMIFSEILQKVINYLSMGNVPEEIIGSIFNMILKMLEKVDNSNPDTDPYPVLFSDPEFLTGLFMHTGLNENDKFDHRVIDIIYNHLFLKGPEKMIDFLLNSKASVDPLMKGLTRKGIKDDKAAYLFNQIFVCHPSVTNLLIDDVIPLIRQFPPGLVIDLMIRCPQIKSTMTQDEFKQWLLEQEYFTLSDVHQVFILYDSLWDDPLSSVLILRTNPPEKLYFIQWIHDMPCLKFEISEELTKETVKQILEPQYTFQTIIDESTKSKVETRDLYLYSRLFVLSLSNPSHIDQSDLPKLYDLLFESDEYLSAAAIQVVTLWIAKYNFIVDYRIVYRIAEIVETSKQTPLRTIYQILLHFIGSQNKVPEMILRTDSSMRYDSKFAKKARIQPWEFPNYTFVFDKVPSYDKYDQKKMLMLLGDISKYLGLVEEEEEAE